MLPSHHLPVVLWSFGGSGNTFARTLLEEASGALTGSVYHSHWLHHTFKADLSLSHELTTCLAAR